MSAQRSGRPRTSVGLTGGDSVGESEIALVGVGPSLAEREEVGGRDLELADRERGRPVGEVVLDDGLDQASRREGEERDSE